jgi:choline dehydrogenase-like flavoprotein
MDESKSFEQISRSDPPTQVVIEDEYGIDRRKKSKTRIPKEFLKSDIDGIIILGAGCASCYMIHFLSICGNRPINVFEAGWYRLKDGAMQNLAIGAPTPANFTQYSNVAAEKSPWSTPFPIGNNSNQWAGLTFQLPYSPVTLTKDVPLFGIPPLGWSQAKIFGGANVHIQGLYVNPSCLMYQEWVDATGDNAWSWDELQPKMMATEKFRAHTDITSQTYDGTLYGPLDGPNVMGPFPINRGNRGIIEVAQAAPSQWSVNLTSRVYDKFQQLGFKNFLNLPTVGQEVSVTFNSGANLCVTVPETWIRPNRNRSAVADYLNETVMKSLTPDIPNPPAYGGQNQNYLVNKGPFVGINGHKFRMELDITVQRIVFKLKQEYRHINPQDYWTHNYKVKEINPKAFKRPLTAIGIEYGPSTDIVRRTFVPCAEVVLSMGALASPIALMQSGIGPADVLKQYGIPVLLDQPNLGKYVGNHYGVILRWKGDVNVWGTNVDTTGTKPVGASASNGYLPGRTTGDKRQFQYFSAYAPFNPPANTQENWSMNLYHLHPKSTGVIKTTQAYDDRVNAPMGGLLGLEIDPGYYTNPEDVSEMAWLLRNLAQMVVDNDNTAVFITPSPGFQTINFPFPDDDFQLLRLFTASTPTAFTAQAHYVGSCGLGPDPKVHCVDNDFNLRGTRNVKVVDASSHPLAIDDEGTVFPLQNDGNTSRSVNALSIIATDKMLTSQGKACKRLYDDKWGKIYCAALDNPHEKSVKPCGKSCKKSSRK